MSKNNLILMVFSAVMGIGLMATAILWKPGPRLPPQVWVQQPDHPKPDTRVFGANQSEIRAICDELKFRYNLFDGRLRDKDRAGAVVAFNTPSFHWQTSDPELEKYSASGLLLRLYRLNGIQNGVHSVLRDWPPSWESPPEKIRARIDAFMDEANALDVKDDNVAPKDKR